MRLKKDQIEKIAHRVLGELKSKHLATFKGSEAAIVERIQKAIHDNLAAEARLDEDAKKLMDQFRAQIAAGQLNQQELFNKIKKQLAKERKFVL